MVDKFVGDSVMAFWGPPFVKPEEHAVLACRAAQAQLAALDALRRELPDLTGLRRDLPAIDLCIGICTGEVVVGNIGSDNTRSYTVIGDTANLAARLERANRVYGTQILVGEATAQAIGSQFEMREINTISAKGKTETTRILELMAAAGQLSVTWHACANAMSKLGGPTSPRTGIWRRRFSANVSKFVPMTVLLVSSLNAFRSFVEIHPGKFGMAYGNSWKNNKRS